MQSYHYVSVAGFGLQFKARADLYSIFMTLLPLSTVGSECFFFGSK